MKTQARRKALEHLRDNVRIRPFNENKEEDGSWHFVHRMEAILAIELVARENAELLEALKEAYNVVIYAAQESTGRVKSEIVGGWIHHAQKMDKLIAKATEQ